MKFKSIKGTKDILPSESHRWQHLERLIRDEMHLFNYREIRTPVFEETALFARGIGELTDIVGKEMYTFEDRSKTLITLKPEMTAAVVRAFLEHNLGEIQPLTKLYYLSPMFRQERPQAGRLRQFHQYGAEAIGGSQPEIDGEIIALAMSMYEILGVGNTTLRINSVGCEACRPAYKTILQEFLRSVVHELSEDSKRRFEHNPLRILDSKDEHDRELTKDAPLMKDHLCPECAAHFDGLRRALHNFGVTYAIDGRIVRGLDYYTKSAFEITCSDLGSQDALAGGGRYDLLAKELGGKPTPAVGFAAGIERLLLVMEKQAIAGDAPPAPRVFLVAADDAGREWVLRTMRLLRSAGVASECDFLGRSIKAQMREADRQNAGFVVVAGSQELAAGEFVLKNMKTREEARVPEAELPARLRNAGIGTT